ncbi:HD-GYP domain-containing protein [Acidobacteriota bacterium]
MISTKRIQHKHADKLVVLIILVGLFIINAVVPYKLGFLNFFYIPIIIAGYFMGRKTAVLTAFLTVLFIFLSYLLFPKSFLVQDAVGTVILVSLLSWGSFLILTSAALGFLYEEKEKKIEDLQKAYNGILEILTKYLEDTDKYTKGHSVRVANMSVQMAQAMKLSRDEVEVIRAAALLHDIGKLDIDLTILNKEDSLTHEEWKVMDSHAEKGAEILSMAGGMLNEAIPIVRAHHHFYNEGNGSKEGRQIPTGANIIAVADSYDAMTTDRPYRKALSPNIALDELEEEAGRQFNPGVVRVFKSLMMGSQEEQTPERSQRTLPELHVPELRGLRNS